MPLLALETLRAFEQGVERDQGNTFRGWLGRVIPHVGDAYRTDEGGQRTHMGSSGIGKECARAVWYGFRWASENRFEGRMLRLFNRGHLEEARFIALLLTIGCKVIQQDENGKQFRISDFGGHYGGSGDGMFYGCPDLQPGTLALSEFKTHNTKSFSKLAGSNWGKYLNQQLNGVPAGVSPEVWAGSGVREAKFEHYVQMQQYMLKMNIGVAVYFAVNKDDDNIYAEVVPFDSEIAHQYLQRAIRIIPMHQPPDKLNKSPSAFGCKFCDHRPVCHLGAPPLRNCRTCEWAVPKEDGKWWCENKDRQMKMLFGPSELSEPGEDFSLSKQRQLTGCPMWAKNSKAF